MLILPPGHAQRVSQRRPFTKRERRIGIVMGIGVLAIVVIAIVALVSPTPKLAPGCISVNVASSLGGQPISGCGAAARTICRDLGSPGDYTGSTRPPLIAACRRAKLPTT
ncbi:MAG TPA: hypothetical protein VG223_12630 [Solirubrobacteraceae bacterium]|nr:hypothetical protein [Solirubrobacteraceae bacterium]